MIYYTLSIVYKGAFVLKKIYLSLIAALVAALLPAQVMAETPAVVLSNGINEISVNVTANTNIKDAGTVIPDIIDCKTEKSQEFTITADRPAVVSLRLRVSNSNSAQATTALNNYNIKINDANGKIIYESASAESVKADALYRDIPIGTFSANEKGAYKITYSLIDSDVDVSDVSMALAVKSNNIAAPTPSATLKPKFDFDALEDKDEFIFDLFDDNNSDSTSQDSTVKSSEITKVCGEDIPAGRFAVSGNGKLQILSSAGGIKSEAVITENPVSGVSVKQTVVALETGDVIKIKPLDGDERARLKFDKVTTDALTSTPTPKNPDDTKDNPKTGDSGVGIAIGVGILAILAIAGLELIKRRGKTNN